MNQVDFYILEHADKTGKLHFACRITQKIYVLGLKVFVQTANSSQSQQLDKLLWTFSQNSFIPHGINDQGDLDWVDYPVQISHTNQHTIDADVLINLLDTVPSLYFKYGRVVELVSSETEDRKSGRIRFRSYQAQGIAPVTHKIEPGKI